MEYEMKRLIAFHKRMSDDPQSFEYDDLKRWLSYNVFLDRNVWQPRVEVLRLAEMVVRQNEEIWQRENRRFQAVLAAMIEAGILLECPVLDAHDIYPGEPVCQGQKNGCQLSISWTNYNFEDVERFGYALMDNWKGEESARSLPDLAEESEILDSVNLQPLVEAISKPYAGRGRKSHDRAPIVRAYFMAYLYRGPISAITMLHWTLLNNPAFRTACGFSGRVPSRPTLSRVFIQISEHPDVVERIMDEIVEKAKRIRPDIRREIAADVTVLGRSPGYRGLQAGKAA